jgi:hypothetical protein
MLTVDGLKCICEDDASATGSFAGLAAAQVSNASGSFTFDSSLQLERVDFRGLLLSRSKGLRYNRSLIHPSGVEVGEAS